MNESEVRQLYKKKKKEREREARVRSNLWSSHNIPLMKESERGCRKIKEPESEAIYG